MNCLVQLPTRKYEPFPLYQQMLILNRHPFVLSKLQCLFLQMLSIRLLLLRKVLSSDLEKIKLPKILTNISSMCHDFFSNGEEVNAYLFGHTFGVYFILSEVSLKLIDVMQQSRENNHRTVGKLKQRVEVCDNVGTLSWRNVDYFVDLL